MHTLLRSIRLSNDPRISDEMAVVNIAVGAGAAWISFPRTALRPPRACSTSTAMICLRLRECAEIPTEIHATSVQDAGNDNEQRPRESGHIAPAAVHGQAEKGAPRCCLMPMRDVASTQYYVLDEVPLVAME